MRNIKRYSFSGLMVVVICGLGLANANAQTAKSRAAASSATAAVQQPLYTNYKGISLGMTAQEVRSTLGAPAMKADDQDYFTFSDHETAQIYYDAAHKVTTISVDYAGGVGAPDHKAVVGAELETRPNGSLYRVVRYESQGFWVSYSRTTGELVIVTITIQKI